MRPDGASAPIRVARAVKVWGRPEWWSPDPRHADAPERLAAQVLDAVIAMAGAV